MITLASLGEFFFCPQDRQFTPQATGQGLRCVAIATQDDLTVLGNMQNDWKLQGSFRWADELAAGEHHSFVGFGLRKVDQPP